MNIRFGKLSYTIPQKSPQFKDKYQSDGKSLKELIKTALPWEEMFPNDDLRIHFEDPRSNRTTNPSRFDVLEFWIENIAPDAPRKLTATGSNFVQLRQKIQINRLWDDMVTKRNSYSPCLRKLVEKHGEWLTQEWQSQHHKTPDFNENDDELCGY